MIAIAPTPPAGGDHWWLAAAVVAAIVSGTVTLLGLWVNGRRARKDRHRQLLAGALADVAAYLEYPFIVRRRRSDDPAGERARISAVIGEVQRCLRHNQAVLRVEAPRVASAYQALVGSARSIAGAAIREAWDIEPISGDAQMHVTDVDLTPVQRFEDAYVVVVRDHLGFTPWWIRVVGRWLLGIPARAIARVRGRAAGAAVEPA